VRIVGACFGHQIVARALGARVGRSGKGWETGVTELELTEKGREIFGKGDLVSDYKISSYCFFDAFLISFLYCFDNSRPVLSKVWMEDFRFF
jgi:hypothetical protein